MRTLPPDPQPPDTGPDQIHRLCRDHRILDPEVPCLTCELAGIWMGRRKQRRPHFRRVAGANLDS